MEISAVPSFRLRPPTLLRFAEGEEPAVQNDENACGLDCQNPPTFDIAVNLAGGTQIVPNLKSGGIDEVLIGGEVGFTLSLRPFDSAKGVAFNYQFSLNYSSPFFIDNSTPQLLSLRHSLGLTGWNGSHSPCSLVALGLSLTYQDTFADYEHYSYLGFSTTFEVRSITPWLYLEYSALFNLDDGGPSTMHQLLLGIRSFVGLG